MRLDLFVTGTAGWLLLTGAGVFGAAAFAPASFVFGMADPATQRAHLERHARSWRWGQLPFALGPVVSAAGVLALGQELGGAPGAALTAAGVLALAVSLPWAEHCRRRAVDVDAFLDGQLPAWHFLVYVWGTLAALAVTGFALLGTKEPQWAAWFVVGASAAFAAAMLRFGDVPPFVFYVVTGVLGLAVR